MAAVMQDLVSGARSARDGVFNTLDAVGRQTRAANAALVEHVRGLTLTRAPDPPEQPVEPERDTRFDPEDEWELPVRRTEPGPAATAAAPRDDTDDDEFSQTWLR
jgi:hypothetical protein